MNKIYAAICTLLLLACLAGEGYSQQVLVGTNGRKELGKLTGQSRQKFDASRKKALALAKKHGWPVKTFTKDGGLSACKG